MSTHVSFHPTSDEVQRTAVKAESGTASTGHSWFHLQIPSGHVTVFVPSDQFDQFHQALIEAVTNPVRLSS